MAGASRCLDASAARPLRAWSAQGAAAVAKRVSEQVLQPWCQQWRLTPGTVTAEDGARTALGSVPLPLPGVRAWWLLDNGDPVAALHELLYGRRPSQPAGQPTLAMQQAAHAWEDLQRECARGLPPAASPVPAAPTARAWSGSLALSLRVNGAGAAWTAVLHLAPEACLGWATPPAPALPATRAQAPLQRADLALAHQPLKLSARLASFELDLGSLQGLCVGDIVTLPHPLDEPLDVLAEVPGAGAADAGPRLLCHAHLGAREAAKAIELLRAPGASR